MFFSLHSIPSQSICKYQQIYCFLNQGEKHGTFLKRCGKLGKELQNSLWVQNPSTARMFGSHSLQGVKAKDFLLGGRWYCYLRILRHMLLSPNRNKHMDLWYGRCLMIVRRVENLTWFVCIFDVFCILMHMFCKLCANKNLLSMQRIWRRCGTILHLWQRPYGAAFPLQTWKYNRNILRSLIPE